MEKPIIFFSHSSKDRDLLISLKKMVVEKTENSIEVFLSCDGQSIPLGKNWVHSVEEALKKAFIMFVFLSPNSLNSHWAFFESGYAYSKDIHVVPVGIFGVDIGLLPPPISLLQGFNIISENSLGNIIAVINKTLEHSHPTAFSKAEYEELFAHSNISLKSSFGDYFQFIDELKIEISNENGLKYNVADAVTKICEFFQASKTEYQVRKHSITTYGINLYAVQENKGKVMIELAPSLTKITLPIVDEILKSVITNGTKGIELIVKFVRAVDYLTDPHKLTAALYNTDVKLGELNTFIWKTVKFEVGHFIQARRLEGAPTIHRGQVYLRVICNDDSLAKIEFDILLKLLFDRGVYFISENM